MDTTSGTRIALTLLVIAHIGCDSPGSGGSRDATPDTSGDVLVDGETSADVALEIGAEVGDSGAETNDATDDREVDVVGGTLASPSVGCLDDAACGAGNVCCTNPGAYESLCLPEGSCPDGLHDACLVDAQCARRRPGEWTVCCHDRGNRNYCAPLAETCQPRVACETPADCVGNGSDTCCSPHQYWEEAFCTSTFFASSPRECP